MRRYGLDWLRIAVVFLLFPFHTARVFDWWEPNYVKDATNAFSTWFVAGLGFWFMALLFVIAGFSSFHALQKRSPREYAKERVLRLLVPLLFGLVLIVPVQGYYASLQHEGFTGSYIQFLSGYFFDFHDLSGYTGGFTPAHLWFILYLFVISMCLLPLLLRLRTPKQGIVKTWQLLLAFVPMTAVEALPAIGGKNPFFYALLFLFGFLMARSGGVMETVRRMRFGTLAAAVVLSPAYIVLASSLGWPGGINLLAGGIALLRNLCVWLIILALMGLADTYLNKPTPALSYFNNASYPVYVLHQSVMMVLAYYIVSIDLSPALKFLAIMIGTLAVCITLYEAFRRIAPTRFILGIKKAYK
jgi:surface polysaccharide O-acyltransferase-like enzyme